MAIDLLFKSPPLTNPPLDLVFGAPDDLPPAEDRTLEVSAKLPKLRGGGIIGSGAVLSASAKLPALRGSGQMSYQSRTERPVVGRVESSFQNGLAFEDGWRSTYNAAAVASSANHIRWQDADALQAELQVRWQSAKQVRTERRLRWQDADAVQRATAIRFQQGTRVNVSRRERWQDADPVHAGTVFRFQQGLPRRNWSAARFQDALPYSSAIHTTEGYGKPLVQDFFHRYQDAIQPPPGQRVRPQPPQPDPCYLPPAGDAVHLLFKQGPGSPALLLFTCETHDGPPPDGETVVVPVQRVYVVINDVWLKHVESGEYIPTLSMSLSIDVDSWTFSFSATCPQQVLSILDPGADAGEQEVEMSINGRVHRLRVESMSRERSFGSTSIRIGGRGRSAELDAPYAPVMNFSNTTDKTAQQLIADVLTLNGVPLDWDVSFGLEDWNVPEGVFSHQGTYMSAINTIAGAAGGYVQPHASLKELRILPRYPSSPWNWATEITPDFELPSAVMRVEGIEWVEKPFYDRVWVSGQQQGPLGRVTRPGASGELLAPGVTEALITDAVVARQRGQRVLSDVGKQARVTLSLPVLAATNIIMPGKFVTYVDGATERLGIVRSTSVETNYPSVTQRIVLETHLGL